MFVLFLLIAFGLLYGYFSTLNIGPVTVHLGWYVLRDIPVYIVILASIGVGILFSTIFYTIKSVSFIFSKNKQKDEITKAKKESAEAMKRIHQLELENAKLKTKYGVSDDDDESI